MLDVAIRRGTIVDGTGRERFVGDVGILGDRIVEVGRVVQSARREIDASGLLVTPGWVDIHSHYDGQATWDPYLLPSGAHGITTTVMGNCGVGFAPVRQSDRAALIDIMEGVEDIPGTALAEGMPWNWESFAEYLAQLDRQPRVMDVAVLVAHSAVRAYVMGPERSIRDDATDDELAVMADVVRDAVAAGAAGLSTSRTKLHLSADGLPVPGSFVEFDELSRLAEAVRDGGGGMLQIVCDWSPDTPDREFEWLRRLAVSSGQPLSFTLAQFDETPRHHERLLELVAEARRAGIAIHAGVGTRPVGMLVNIESRIHPFSDHPSFRQIAHLEPETKRLRMLDPELKRRLLNEESQTRSSFWRPKLSNYAGMFLLGDPPDYEPTREQSVAALAAAGGTSPQEFVYDLLAADTELAQWLFIPLINYSDGTLEAQREMMLDPGAVISLADGGAHCGLICDASQTTFNLTHWVKGRRCGPRLSLERMVELQTSRTARAWGFRDRGDLSVGQRADLNLIDFEALRLLPPRWVSDLPAGGRRLLQDAEGYVMTIAGGQVTWEGGRPTGALPGRVVRSLTPAPA